MTMAALPFEAVPFTPVVPPPAVKPYIVRAVSRPATAFTGDFFMATDIDGALWFALGDFAGHGLRAALFMSMVQETLEETIHACHSNDPAEVVASLDAALRDVLPLNRFATVVLGRAEADGRVQVVNAGHCPPLLLRRGLPATLVGSHGPMVGIVPGASWRQETIQLERGERLLLYTDGIVEAHDESEEEFGLARLMAAAGDGTIARMEDLIEGAESFAGKLHDDATVMLIERK